MSVAAIVLAAGAARVLRRARKLLADYRGCPLARCAVRAALASKASKTIVVTVTRAAMSSKRSLAAGKLRA